MPAVPHDVDGDGRFTRWRGMEPVNRPETGRGEPDHNEQQPETGARPHPLPT